MKITGGHDKFSLIIKMINEAMLLVDPAGIRARKVALELLRRAFPFGRGGPVRFSLPYQFEDLGCKPFIFMDQFAKVLPEPIRQLHLQTPTIYQSAEKASIVSLRSSRE